MNVFSGGMDNDNSWKRGSFGVDGHFIGSFKGQFTVFIEE
jgi:hypothetical protein